MSLLESAISVTLLSSAFIVFRSHSKPLQENSWTMDKALGLQALKEIIFSGCPRGAFKTCMSPSLMHSLIF